MWYEEYIPIHNFKHIPLMWKLKNKEEPIRFITHSITHAMDSYDENSCCICSVTNTVTQSDEGGPDFSRSDNQSLTKMDTS